MARWRFVRKRLLLLFVLCLSLLLQGGAAQAVDGRPAKRQRLGPRRYGQRLVWSYDVASFITLTESATLAGFIVLQSSMFVSFCGGSTNAAGHELNRVAHKP
jgi:hypothetical protein